MRAYRVASLFVFASAFACSSEVSTSAPNGQSGETGGSETVVETGAGGSATGGTAPAGGSATVGSGGSTVLSGGSTVGSGGAPPSGGNETTGGTTSSGGAGAIGGNPTVGGTSGQTGGGSPSGGASGDGSGGTSSGGGGTGATGGSESTGGTAGTGGGGPTPTFEYPAPVAPWQPSQACVDRAAEVLAGMTLRQKAGQMVQANCDNLDPGEVSSYQFGSVFSGGSSDPPTDDTPQTWRNFVTSFEAAAMGFGIPLIYGIDAVHGHNNVSDAVLFPHSIGLGATRDPDLIREIGRITAREMRGTSMDWTFGPAISPAQDERWGRTFESYSEEPALTAELAVALVEGLQGTTMGGSESVLACAKHFAGDGATQGGDDQGNCVLDEATFRRVAVEVYQPLINAGLGSIMVSYSSYNGEKMTGNTHWLTDVLKGEMGFRGIVGSDWAATSMLPGGSGTGTSAAQTAAGVNAGLDMLMEPYSGFSVVGHIEAGPTAGGSEYIPQSRIDDAVTRILTIKCELGMLEPGYDPSGDAALLSTIGSAAHRDVARQAVRESLVLLENDGGVLPLPQTARVHLAGSGADSLQRQCGGWTIDWQGLGIVGQGATPGVTSGTTIRQGIEALIGAGNVSYSQDGSGVPSDAAYIIVVLSEPAYAEGQGDATNLDLDARTPDVSVLQTASATGKPVVAVLLSGRPLIIEPYLNLADAWVAAWLPGSEGDGVADVLFGIYPPTGQLGHTWPRTMAQIPINIGDPDYESDPPLYPFGYGLSYED
jgi:beta-glucosidase